MNSYTRLFQDQLQNSVEYWLDYLTNPPDDLSTLYTKRTQITRVISFGLERLESPAERAQLGQLIRDFSSYMERAGHWNAWQKILERAITVAQQNADRSEEMVLTFLLARLSKHQGRTVAVRQHYRRVVKLARQVGDRETEARACSNLGYLFIDQGLWWRAEQLNCYALTHFRQLADLHGQAHTENHLGYLYTRQRRWQAAQHHLDRACELWAQNNDLHGLTTGQLNLGLLHLEMMLYDQQSDYPVALTYLKQALQYAQMSHAKAVTGTILMNIGNFYHLSGDYAQAKSHHWQAETIFRQFNNTFGLAQVYGNLGLACLAEQNWSEGQQHLATACQLWQIMNDPYGELKTLLRMAEGHQQAGHTTQAEQLIVTVQTRLTPFRKMSRFRPVVEKSDKLSATPPN